MSAKLPDMQYPYSRIFLHLSFIFFFAAVPFRANANYMQQTNGKKFVLVIDPGHGRHDPGAIGSFAKEKNINLNVALAFGRLVERNCHDVKVVYTRKKDVFIPLKTRADIANHNKADLFVSIHTNSLPSGRIAYGAETYTLGMARTAANLEVAKRENSVITYEKNYQQTYEGFDPNKAESYIIFELLQDRNMKQSVDLAKCIQQQYTSCGRKNRGVQQAGYLVLQRTTMPAVLTELGFISTPEEERYLSSDAGVNELARGIYNGFIKYRRMYGNTIAAELLPTEKTSIPEVVPVATGDTSQASEAASDISPSSKDKAETKNNTPKENIPQQEKDIVVQQQNGNNDTAETDTSRPVFKIQLMAVDRPLKTGDTRLKGLKGIEYYRDGNLYKYTYGSSCNYTEIRRLQKQISPKFPDTFIVAFIDGQRTDLAAAIRKSKQ